LLPEEFFLAVNEAGKVSQEQSVDFVLNDEWANSWGYENRGRRLIWRVENRGIESLARIFSIVVDPCGARASNDVRAEGFPLGSFRIDSW
jgi:hypothetical protein